MADLTIYFPSSGAAAHDCAYSAIWEGTGGTTWPTSYASRFCSGVAVQNNVSCPEGGHIVVEIGFKYTQVYGFDCRIVGDEGAAGAGA
jgi:hypothetical protein